MKLKEKIEGKSMTFEQLDEDLFKYSYQPNTYVDLDLAKQLVMERLEYANNREAYTLVNIKNMIGISREANNFLAGEPGTRGVIAGAIITGNVITQVFANMYLAVKKQLVPVKLFKNEHQALKWLKKQKEHKMTRV